MWWNLVSLSIVFWNCGFSSAQIPAYTVKIHDYARLNDTDRLFYTNMSMSGVFSDYTPADYPVKNNLEIFMLSEAPENCACPDLVTIHSVTTSSGQLKFERADKMTPDMKDHGFAGYLAPFPGYCGSTQVELIEFYSPVLNVYRYFTSNNYRTFDVEYYFRPVRVLGYAYITPYKVMLSGSPPFINQQIAPTDSFFYKAISVKFDMVYLLRKGNKKSYVASPQLIRRLVETEGWSFSPDTPQGRILAGPLSHQNDLAKIREICGADSLQRCRDTYNQEYDTYRPLNLDVTGAGDREITADCGYFIKNTTTCFPEAIEYFSFNAKVGHGVMYRNTEYMIGYNSVGKASPSIFALLR